MVENILVMGAGGVGGYFGGRIAEKTDCNVFFIARDRHLQKIREAGLKILSADGDIHLTVDASDKPTDAPEPDLVLFTVKSQDTDQAI
ncbi:MAG: ketopantoate reductase family protein, partial [Balneolaceae bacterium]